MSIQNGTKFELPQGLARDTKTSRLIVHTSRSEPASDAALTPPPPIAASYQSQNVLVVGPSSGGISAVCNMIDVWLRMHRSSRRRRTSHISSGSPSARSALDAERTHVAHACVSFGQPALQRHSRFFVWSFCAICWALGASGASDCCRSRFEFEHSSIPIKKPRVRESSASLSMWRRFHTPRLR